MQRQIPPGRDFSCITPTLAPILAALSVTCSLRKWKDRSHSPLFRTSAKVRYLKSRLTRNAAAGNAYNVAGMASLLQAVRNAGANNVVILGGALEPGGVLRATSR